MVSVTEDRAMHDQTLHPEEVSDELASLLLLSGQVGIDVTPGEWRQSYPAMWTRGMQTLRWLLTVRLVSTKLGSY